MQLEFYWDGSGDPRAHCEGPGAVVAGFLESDLQGSVAAAHEVLRAIEDIEAGGALHWESTGNAYTLVLTRDGATLQNEMDEGSEPYPLSLSQLRQVVADWISFLDDGRSSF